MNPKSPTPRLLFGLGVALAAVCVFFWYARNQITRLRVLQTDIVDRNRRDSLQLLRIQNNLNSLSQSLRDLRDGSDVRSLPEVQSDFRQIHSDLDDALQQEQELAPAVRAQGRQRRLMQLVNDFWVGVDAMFGVLGQGKVDEARRLIANRLQPSQRAINVRISALLVQNHQENAAAAGRIQSIYVEVERNLYFFLVAMLIMMGLSGSHLIRANRRLFEQLVTLSEQRRVLAARLFTVQEDILRSVSRELHDEFGQILTAIGALLLRAEKMDLPKDSLFSRDLLEVREIAQESLGKVRSLSHALRPTLLDDYGLEKAIEGHIDQFQRQTGITVLLEKEGEAGEVSDQTSIHVFRIVQEALNNIAKHARVKEASVRAKFSKKWLRIEVEEHGVGLSTTASNHGLGLIAMRERAELVGGSIEFERPRQGGTRIILRVPLEKEETI